MTAAETLQRAAKMMRERAEAATPGPWERPLDTRHKDFIGAALPEDEEPHTWQGGIIPESLGQHKGYQYRYAGQRERVCVVQCPTDSLGDHARKRGGRDLEYIASMHPGVALAVADWLDDEAERAAGMAGYEDSDAYPLMLDGFRHPLAVARAYLGDGPRVKLTAS
jgi:hypothetical protein